MTVDEVRQHLAVSRTYVYHLLASGAIPSVRLGRARRIRPSDLAEYIRDRLEDGIE